MTEYKVKLRSLKLMEKALAGLFFEHCVTYPDGATQNGLMVGFFTGLLWCADVPLKTKPLDWKKIRSSRRLDKDAMYNYAEEVIEELDLLGINTEVKILELSIVISDIIMESLGWTSLTKESVAFGEQTANFS